MTREFSAGGVVSRDGKLLLVRVCNLQGKKVWTFPKGHPERGESARQAALREVEEETGWRCRALGGLLTVSYRFARQGRPVDKKVRWFRMAPVERVGRPDALEVLSTRWAAPSAARRLLRYPSDVRLLAAWKSGRSGKARP